jgi:protein gp37
MPTPIEWIDETWNPTRGCSRVSQGCANCYAERVAYRFTKNAGLPGPFEGFVTIVNGHASWTGKVDLVESVLDKPRQWKSPRRIFVNSMSDLFHEGLTDEQITRVFDVMGECPQHTFQILTKRAWRMLKYFHYCPRVLPNVWMGVSAEDQRTLSERLPLLLRVPAFCRFISYEPALGEIDVTPWVKEYRGSLHWVIAGGESGPGSRPANVEWFRNVRDQCITEGIAFFFKQWGAHGHDGVLRLKKDNGRMLDGREWAEFPDKSQRSRT